MIAIHLKMIGHRFNGPWLFRHITQSFSSGDMVLITGNNGSGKSTLLNIISQLHSPREGSVQIQSAVELPLLNRHQWCGFLNPGVQLYSELTAEEHLQLSQRTRQRDFHPDFSQWKDRALPSNRDWNKPVKSFSSGMKQRLKLLLAIGHSPSLLILDEPMSNLDQAGREWFEHILFQLKPTLLTFFATNDPADLKLGSSLLDINALKK